jgi:nucleotidyltransferase substrate binding protein (TIGR01987 family)
MTEGLDLTPLARATQRLAEGLARYHREPSDDQIRDGLIQRFEFTYEISQKMLKRYLESVSPTSGAYDAMAFSAIIRSANEQGLLLGDWAHWKLYRVMRGKTSHTYNETIALEVVGGIPAFLTEARYLLSQLEGRCSG